MLNKEFQLGCIKPFHTSGGTSTSHMLYADNLLIFANGGRNSIRKLLEVLRRYEGLSGKLINSNKSSIFFFFHYLFWQEECVEETFGF